MIERERQRDNRQSIGDHGRQDTEEKQMFILLRGEGILDTNYSCAYAPPHLMRRVHLYLEDSIKTETEKKSKE